MQRWLIGPPSADALTTVWVTLHPQLGQTAALAAKNPPLRQQNRSDFDPHDLTEI